MLKQLYGIIWPFVFFGFGIYALMAESGGHGHHGGGMPQVFGLELHTLMWFLMGLAHADSLWRRGGHCSC